MKDLGSIKDQIRNKSYKSAISSLNNFIKKNPNNIEANYLLGYSLELNEEVEKSILQYEKTNELKEGFQIYDRLALLYAKKNDYRFIKQESCCDRWWYRYWKIYSESTCRCWGKSSIYK